LGFVVKGILPCLINSAVAGHAFLGADISGLCHGQGGNKDQNRKEKKASPDKNFLHKIYPPFAKNIIPS
jgi:hypothetical protein